MKHVMTSKNRIFLIGAIILTTIAATQAPQQGQADWNFVPAFATSCFAEDDFSERLEAARTAISAAMEKQDKINTAARERFDNMDGMEKAQRMQAFMMKNPQAAMKMMQAQQAAGTAGQTTIAEVSESSTRLEAELERLQGAFRTAAEQAVKPVRARQDALIKAKTIPVGEVAMPAFTAAADHAQYVQLIAEENAAYERACAPYFGANGSFHKWAGSYRTEVSEKLGSDVLGDDMMVMQLQAMGLPGGDYRDTSPLQHTSELLRRVGDIWKIRQNTKTKPSISLVKK